MLQLKGQERNQNSDVCCQQARHLPSTGQTTRQFAAVWPDICCWRARQTDNQTTRQFAAVWPDICCRRARQTDNQTTRHFAVDGPVICHRQARQTDNQTTRHFAVDGPVICCRQARQPDNQTVCRWRARHLPSTGPTSAVDGPDNPFSINKLPKIIDYFSSNYHAYNPPALISKSLFELNLKIEFSLKFKAT